MVTSVSENYLDSINQSIIYFLKNESYIRSGSGSFSQNTLSGFFPNIKIKLGHYPSLEKVELPSIYLAPPSNLSGGESEAYGNYVQIEDGTYQLQAFMGRQASHEDNLVQQDKLASDLKSLFTDQDYISLYEFDIDDNTVIDTGLDIGLSNPSLSYIPPVEQPEAARYRFTMNFDVEYIKRIL